MQNRPTLLDRGCSTKDCKSDTAALNDLQVHRILAWKITIKQPQVIVMNSPTAYEIGVADRAGMPVSGTMEVLAYRASDARKDFTTVFKEVSPSNYQGYINFPLKGYWELRIRSQLGGEIFAVIDSAINC